MWFRQEDHILKTEVVIRFWRKLMFRIQNSQSYLVALASAILIAYSAPAFAMTGSEAVRACAKKTGCEHGDGTGPDGSIIITVDGYDKQILCPSLTEQCVVFRKGTKKRLVLDPRVFLSGRATIKHVRVKKIHEPIVFGGVAGENKDHNHGGETAGARSGNGGVGNCGGKLSAVKSDKGGHVTSETCTKKHLTVTCTFVPGHPVLTFCSRTTFKAVRNLLGAKGPSKVPAQDFGGRSGSQGTNAPTTTTTPLSIVATPPGGSGCAGQVC
jgi:hypothetical protein